jgi:general secretion pathway protein C
LDIARTLEKNHRWILLVPMPLLGFLNASGVASLVAASLPHGAELSAASRARSNHAPPFHSTAGDAILARNPFDSVTGPLVPHPATPAGTSMPLPEAPPCEGVRVVVIAASAEPEWSLVAVQAVKGDGHSEPLLRRRGDKVGPRTVLFVDWDRVWMEDEGRLCQSALFEDRGVEGAPKLTLAAPQAAPAGSLDPSIRKGIVAKSATDFDVDRGVLERVLGDVPTFLGTTRARLEKSGVSLAGIGPETLLGALGLANGDHLESVNGFDLTQPDAALQAVARLHDAAQLVLKVNRGGREIELDYAIR